MKVQKKAKNKAKTQTLKIMKLTTTNRRAEDIRTFKDIFSNLVNRNESLDDITLSQSPTLLTISLSEKSKQVNSIYHNI